jgi:hypothetical protein
MNEITPEHSHSQTVRFVCYFPEHEPREGDSHYHLFNQARARLQRQGLLKCWRCAATQEIQLHHSIIEFSLANGVDVAKFSHLYPEFHVEDDEDFARFIEGEGNLTPLCIRCHIGEQAIHLLPYPAWIAGRFWREGLPAPAQVSHEK